MAKQVRTEAFIAAPPLRVWEVLADFDGYAEWNPLNIRASGHAAPGARIPMTFRNPARAGSTIDIRVTITECVPGKALAWIGRIPVMFTGRHFFRLAPEGEGTRLEHGEDMSGLIPLTFSRRTMSHAFGPAYEAVNAALADRVAALASAQD